MNAVEALFEEKPVEAITPEPVIEPAAEPAVEERPAPEPAPEPTPAPAPIETDDKRVPLATFLDVRDEAKELKRKVAEYEANASRAAPQEMPDPYDDPQGFASWNRGQVAKEVTNLRFEMSDMMAKQTHGVEAVEAAAAWAVERANTDPGFAQSYMTHNNPMDWIVRQHKQADLIKQIGENPDDYVRRRAQEMGLLAPTPAFVPVAAQQAPATPEPPRSLAAAPSRGGGVKDVPVGPMAALESLFKG